MVKVFLVVLLLVVELSGAANNLNARNRAQHEKTIAQKIKSWSAPRPNGPLRLQFEATNKAKKDACSDEAKNCREFISYCTEPSFGSLLRQYCKKGCGYCAPPADKCEDVFKTCAAWAKEDFCHATFISENLRRAMCAKTCDLCEKPVNKPPVDCKDDDAACLRTQCAKTEKKTTEMCKKWCAGNGKDNEECLDFEVLCTKTEEKTKPANSQCDKYCKNKDGTVKNTAACKCDATGNSKNAEWCLGSTCTLADKDDGKQCQAFCGRTENAAHEACRDMEVFCKTTAEKTKPKNSECDKYCRNKDGTIKDTDACKCSATDNNKKAEWCVATTCTFADKNDGAQCQAFCTKPENANTFACKDMEALCTQTTEKQKPKGSECDKYCRETPTTIRNTNACECTKTNNPKKAEWCLESTCAFADKNDGSQCQAFCARGENANAFACRDMEDLCSNQPEKEKPAGSDCDKYCRDTPTTIRTTNSCKCDKAGNPKKAAWCVATTCTAADKTDGSKCQEYCAGEGAGKANCV